MKLSFVRFCGVSVFSFQLLLSQVSYSGLESWYHPELMSMAGSGAVLASVESDRINPAALWGLPRQFHLSILRYPADIGAESLSLILPANKGFYALSLRHLGYGVFQGYGEEGEPTKNYTAGDTWLTVSIGNRLAGRRTVWGLTAGAFFSQLESYESIVLTVTAGFMFIIDEIDGRVGLSVQNVGTVVKRYTKVTEPAPTALVGGVSKKLAHLPLELCFDVGHRFTDKFDWVRLGGVFFLPYQFQLKWGMSTDKFDQQTQTGIATDFFSSSGLGLSYHFQEYHLDLGGYFYGTGGWVTGIGFGVEF